MKRVKFLALIPGALALALHACPGAVYAPPTGGWRYVFTGDADSSQPPPGGAALDSTWNDNNGSDEWDTSRRGFGDGAPGGVESNGRWLTMEDATNVLTGTANNRKLYFTRDFARDGVVGNTILDSGITLSFRARLTPTDELSEIPMPNGYGIYSDGKGMFGVRQSGGAGGLISFSLTGTTNDGPSDTPAYTVGQAGLVMNRRNGDVPGANVDINEAGTLNLLPLDPAQWHEFWITIQANDATAGNGTHLVRVYVDGSVTPTDFNVTAGNSSDINATNYLAMGLNNSPSLGAFDTDFFAYKPGVFVPVNSGLNDSFFNPAVLTGTLANSGGSTRDATDETNEPEHSALPNAQRGSRRTLWWSWTAASPGAVVLTVTRTNVDNFPNPMLTVWTGNNLATLTSVASNFSGVAQCRVVLTAIPGTTYRIAVDDSGDEFSDDGIQFRLQLLFVPPPANDDFTYRTPIASAPFDVSGSFIGATRQAGEPTHGASVFSQTLWWTWTAPAGLFTNRATLHVDTVSFPPDVGVYTGNAFPLTAAPGVINTPVGATRVVSFLAVPGTTYQFAVAGDQADPAPNAGSTNYGQYRLRFNASTLALVITNRTGGTNTDFLSPFFETVLLTNGLRIENWGNATSRPVRVRLEASPGFSVRADAAPPAFPATSNLFTSASVLVPRSQSVSMLATGRCPAPYNPDFDSDRGIGYGVFAFLEEQVDTAWFAVDHQLAGFGLWPEVGGFAGPGGGVIRIDPQAGSGVACIPVLQQIQINGPASITEGSTVNLSATAVFNCPSNLNFTTTVWSNSHPGSVISTNGVLRAGSVTNDTPVMVSCYFEYRGVLSNATRQLMIGNLPSPFIASRARLGNGTFLLSGSGVAGRGHAIQASTNLCCASNWVTLIPTNVIATNGLWGFLDTNAPAHPRRFYRVREGE